MSLLCGSTECLHASVALGSAWPCMRAERLFLPQLAAGTPAEQWSREHVLAKLRLGLHFEQHLQAVALLAAAWQRGGAVLEAGARLPGIPVLRAWALMEDAVDKEEVLCAKLRLATIAGLRGVGHVHGLAPQSRFASRLLTAVLNASTWPHDWSGVAPTNGCVGTPCLPVRCEQWWAALPRQDESVLAWSPGGGGGTQGGVQRAGSGALAFGTLSYQARRVFLHRTGNNGMNVGDEMQGLAGLQFLPHLDTFVERDALNSSLPLDHLLDFRVPRLDAKKAKEGTASRSETILFLNAWYGSSLHTWPPPRSLHPVLGAIHVEPAARATFIAPRSLNYLRREWPVGARDPKTHRLFQQHEVLSFFSGCYTLTLAPPCSRGTGHRSARRPIIVDVPKEVAHLVPATVRARATEVSHKELDALAVSSQMTRYRIAFRRFQQYTCDASILITSRLHAALPAMASGIPVVLIDNENSLPGGGGKAGAARLDGLSLLVHRVNSAKTSAAFNWSEPPPNPQPQLLRTLRARLRLLAMCRDPNVADAALKFGVVPASWATTGAHIHAGRREEVCPELVAEPSSGLSSGPKAIRIATCLDEKMLTTSDSLPFATWLNALARSSTADVLVLYVLVVGLSAPQRCLVHALIQGRLARGSRVHVLDVNGQLASYRANYRGLGHVPVLTQVRLNLHELLPCVDKVLWLDMDLLVLQSLRSLWAVQPATRCGIAARESLTTTFNRDHMGSRASLLTSAQRAAISTKGFNAGVMVLSLAQLRLVGRDFATLRSVLAEKLGANDQTTLTAFCAGNFTRLERRWNVFHETGGRRVGKDPAMKEPAERWGILHWTSSRKPWLRRFRPTDDKVAPLWREYATNFTVMLDASLARLAD